MSESSRDEFHRRIGELMRSLVKDIDRAVCVAISGALDTHPRVREAIEKRENVVLHDGRTYGLLLSGDQWSELESIRGDALLYLIDRSDQAAEVVAARARRILGTIFITVELPHTPLGDEGALDLGVEDIGHLFTIAYLRGK